MAFEVKVTRQGQTTIPKELRDRYRIKEGDKVLYIDVGGYMVVLPMSKDPLKESEERRKRAARYRHIHSDH